MVKRRHFQKRAMLTGGRKKPIDSISSQFKLFVSKRCTHTGQTGDRVDPDSLERELLARSRLEDLSEPGDQVLSRPVEATTENNMAEV